MDSRDINNLLSLMERLKVKVEFVQKMSHDITPEKIEKLTKAVEKAVEIKMSGVERGKRYN